MRVLYKSGVLLALLLLLLALFGCSNSVKKEEQPVEVGFAIRLSTAEYEEQMQYPREEDFYDENGEFDAEAYMDQEELYYRDNPLFPFPQIDRLSQLRPFFSDCAEDILSETENENIVCSPLSLYYALAILAESTDGNSRAQILECLGAESIEALRTQVKQIWDANYLDNGISAEISGNSLWLGEQVAYRQDTLDLLAENYYASAYQVKMGSEEGNKAYQNWMNEATRGFLQEQSAGENLDSETRLSIASTIYFHMNWMDEFVVANTKPAVFHGTKGDTTCDFMNQTFYITTYYYGEGFGAVVQQLNNNRKMYYILPDEGVSVEELLSDKGFLRFFSDPSGWENKTSAMVHFSVPKYDVSATLDLSESLKAMGITDVFRPKKADFSPLTDSKLFLTQANQSVRLQIDENGCTAGVVTNLNAGGAGRPSEEIEFVLDRPFLFMVTDVNNIPIFMGVVNQM